MGTSVAPRMTPQPHPPMGGPAATMSPGRQMYVQRVRRELDLTPGQSAQMDQIMRDSHRRMAKIYEPIAPQAREETRRVRQEIQAILTPEQKKKFNESSKRRQHEAEERKTFRQRSDTNAPVQPPS